MASREKELVERIPRVDGLLPDHLASRPTDETDAVLLDAWSRPHPLPAETVIGREAACQVAIFQVSVSRRHAELRYDVDEDRWTIADLGSRNGTLVDGERITAPRALADRTIVVIGDVGFVFIEDRGTLPTSRPLRDASTAQSLRRVGELRLWPPSAGGTGIAGNSDLTVTLGATQFALLRLLAEREDYVRTIDLIADLPWNTPHPEDNHVKQQIRRLRRALDRLGFPDAIESRHGLGYRLRVKTVFET